MTRRPRRTGRSPSSGGAPSARGGTVRIIGGRFRGRLLACSGDPRTRPMKDRVREAIFNWIGPAVRDKQVLDLFAGTGALALEALSRGASGAILIEQHFPTARGIEENAALLGVSTDVEVVAGSAFFWARRRGPPADRPWLVFCSPPYDYYAQRDREMYELIGELYHRAPAESLLVVEADRRLDVHRLPESDRWEVRTYSAALVAVARIDSGPAPESSAP